MTDILRLGDLLVEGIANARKVAIPGAAHHLNMERPKEFNKIVMDFLSAPCDRRKATD